MCDFGHDNGFPAPGSQGIARGGEMSMVRSSLAKCEGAECTVENKASGIRQLELNPSLIKHD